MIKSTVITVNGIEIAMDDILAEMQYHPADKVTEARAEAARALIVRELLLQEAARQNIGAKADPPLTPEEMIEQLLEREITTPEAEEDICRTWFENNRQRFHTAPLYQVSHILLPAPPGDREARAEAEARAMEILGMLQHQPERFGALAREHSACSSAKQDGGLGQITKGQTLPAFEAALADMQPGDISPAPVETEVGFHIIKVHEREDGRQLPYEAVSDWIGSYLQQSSWQRAISQYIRILAGKADIQGFELDGADSPLVQ